jgi:hypothetical protein
MDLSPRFRHEPRERLNTFPAPTAPRIAELHRRINKSLDCRSKLTVVNTTGAAIKNNSAFNNRKLAKRWFSPDGRDWLGWVYLKTPGAYVVQRSGKLLYVGSTSTTFEERICSHHVIARFGLRWSDLDRDFTLALADTDVVTFFECRNGFLARLLEQELIDMFTPPYNRRNAIDRLHSLTAITPRGSHFNNR